MVREKIKNNVVENSKNLITSNTEYKPSVTSSFFKYPCLQFFFFFLEMQLTFFRAPRTNLRALEVGNRQCASVLCADTSYGSKLYLIEELACLLFQKFRFCFSFLSLLRKKLFLIRINNLLNMGGRGKNRVLRQNNSYDSHF